MLTQYISWHFIGAFLCCLDSHIEKYTSSNLTWKLSRQAELKSSTMMWNHFSWNHKEITFSCRPLNAKYICTFQFQRISYIWKICVLDIISIKHLSNLKTSITLISTLGGPECGGVGGSVGEGGKGDKSQHSLLTTNHNHNLFEDLRR